MQQMGLCTQTTDFFWYVAHTRPRREKKLAGYCKRAGLAVILPCIKSRKRYGRKTVEFDKPLFPGYVFFKSEPERVRTVYQNHDTANVLTVFDQITFQQQLGEIVYALENECLVVGTNRLCAGASARIVKGALAGMTGRVLKVANQITVVLNLDFIGRGAAVVVDSTNLEIVD
jgi:transcriptional antiterminator RfaH